MGIEEMKDIIMEGDTFEPIVDNAEVISQLACLGEETRQASDFLDLVGNVLKALAKGFDLGAATMSDLVILFAYMLEFARPEGFTLINLDQYVINLLKPAKEVGFFLAAMPYFFSALTIQFVN